MRLFQYRNKRGSRKDIYETSLRLAGPLKKAGAVFIVNDHADIALATDADGVHLGQDDLPLREARKLLGANKIIGISTHNLEQARAAESGGADYLGFGPVFTTTTKDAGLPRGVEQITLVRRAVALPLLAIGGITGENAGEAVRAGADGVAVISAVLSAQDIAAAAATMIRQMEKARGRHR